MEQIDAISLLFSSLSNRDVGLCECRDAAWPVQPAPVDRAAQASDVARPIHTCATRIRRSRMER